MFQLKGFTITFFSNSNEPNESNESKQITYLKYSYSNRVSYSLDSGTIAGLEVFFADALVVSINLRQFRQSNVHNFVSDN